MSLPLTHKHQHENQHESHKKVGLGGLAYIYIYPLDLRRITVYVLYMNNVVVDLGIHRAQQGVTSIIEQRFHGEANVARTIVHVLDKYEVTTHLCADFLQVS